jgi:large subunit ribosomal protein L32
MAVPKRKTSKARRDSRHSTRFIRPQAITACDNCSKPIVPHCACEGCGFYKGAKVLRTKVERTLKRGESRRAQQTQQGLAEPNNQTSNTQ